MAVWNVKDLGFGLDPLAILVPFLVFAIGVSHGIQQVNQITKEVIEGQTAEYAARASFKIISAWNNGFSNIFSWLWNFDFASYRYDTRARNNCIDRRCI